MTVPANQNFNFISGTLGAGSATIGGVTYFSNDPNAVLSSVSSTLGNALRVDGDHLGFKSADGSAFSLVSLVIENPLASCFFQGHRDGVLVASTSELFSNSLQAPVAFGTDFSYIDEFRLIDPSNLPTMAADLFFTAPLP